uniref:Ig-like domain-containing protein n=1 Tax=Meloidogyne incognita TaxID=6306 RepID=A0A914KKC3_MELIC
MVLRVMYVIELMEAEEGGIELVDPSWCPEEGPPRRKVKSPPVISPTGSSTSLYSGGSSQLEWQTTGTALEMQGTKVTRTQYGFRTLQESSAKMCLKVTGYPLPDITWYKDNVLVREDDRHTFYADEDGFFALTIDPVQTGDTGRYTCVATNEYGQASTSAFFRVLKVEKESASPDFVKMLEPSDRSCKEGDVVDFECQVSGWPEPELLWLMDGQPLRPSHDFRIQYDGQRGTLQIRDAQPDDTGTYTVRITNDYGVAETRCRLEVQSDPDRNHVSPEFQAVLEDADCNEGDTVKFKAILTGDPNPEVIWYINGIPLTQSEKVSNKFMNTIHLLFPKIQFISEDGICILTVKDVNRHQDGTVTCQGKNRLGSSSCEARLRVRVPPLPPYFERPLEDRMITENGAVMFELDVVGYPEPKVEFLLKGRPLIDGVGGVEIRQLEGNYRLTIPDCKIDSHDGELLCRAQNDHGQAESRARLTVEPEEEESRSAPTFTVKHGEHAIFEAIARGSPLPVLSWFINGNKLDAQTQGVISIESTGEGTGQKITLDSAHWAGTILCRAENAIGRFETKARLIVLPPERRKQPPVFRKPLTDKTENEGDSAVFEVCVDPESLVNKFIWRLNGVELNNGDREGRILLSQADGGIGRLEFNKCRVEDGGIIECIAVNTEGETSTSSKFSVTVGPPTKKGRFDGAEEESEASSLITKVENIPPVTIVVGDQKVLATEGEPMEVQFYGGLKPTFTKGLEGAVLECRPGDNLIAEVEVSDAQTIKWFKNNIPLEDGKEGIRIEQSPGRSRLIIPNIQIGQNGQLKVEAENENGKSESNGQVRILVENGQGSTANVPVQIRKPLTDITVIENDTAEFRASVIGTPTPNIRWLLNGTPVEGGDENIQITSRQTGDQTEHTLRIPRTNISAHNGARVVLRATQDGQGDGVQSEANIHVHARVPGPPYFSRQPQDHDVYDDVESVKFSAIVHGEPVPTVTWSLKGQVLTASDQLRIRHDTSTGKTSIRIFHPRADTHTGEIRVLAENIHGATEAFANLLVQPKADLPRFLTDMDDKLVPEGADIKFIVRIEETVPPAEVQWTLNGKPLSNGDNIRITKEGNNHILEITNVKKEQAGECACIAKNSAGTKRQNSQLTVKEVGVPPTFARNLEDRLMDDQQILVLEAQLASGVRPEPTVKWFRDGVELQSSERVKLVEEGDIDHRVYRMTILRIEMADKGRITIQAENQFGKCECTANVGIQRRQSLRKPQFLSELGPITVTEGDTLNAKVIISGDPTPYTKWYINNQMVYQTEDTEMVHESGVYTLKIHGCTRDMTGTIRCVAGNKMGEAIIEGKLVVVAPVPVEFETGLCDATCREGDTLRLKAVLLGEPMPEVSWFINGNKLVESQNCKITTIGTTYTVLIRNITQDYAGSVVCEAVNEFGKASSQATLRVLPRGEPPDFIEWLSNVRARQGSEVIHKVVYTGEPRPSISWFINNQEIVSSTEEIIITTTENTSTLTIRSFNPERHVGEIICKAENDAGEVSCTANMATYTSDMFTESESGSQVEERLEEDLMETMRTSTPIMAPAFITKIKDTRIQRGHQAIFECVVPDTKGVCCKWLHDGMEIELIARIRVQVQTIEGFTTSELVIDAVEPEDAGKYTVIVENEAGRAQCEAELTVVETMDKPVQMPPDFSIKLQDKSVPLTERVTFECKVTGLPEPQIGWLQDGKPLDSLPGVRTESDKGIQRLIIESVERIHEACYTCSAENVIGKAETSANLRVETMAPVFTRPPTDLQTQLGGQAVLECHVKGIPQPTVEFYSAHDNFRIQTGTRVSIQHDATNIQWRMVIKEMQQGDFRTYRAVARNEIGQVQCEAKIVEQETSLERPRIIEPLKRSRVREGETVEMGVRVAGGRPGMPLEVEWFKNGTPLVPADQRVRLVEYRDSGEFKLIIEDARMEDAGDYGIQISNQAGKDSSHAQLAVDKKEELQKAPEFTQPLRDVSIRETETVVLTCTVSGEPKPQAQWSCDGKPVSDDGQRIRIISETVDEIQERHSVTITTSTPSESGLYTCKAVNPAGEAETRGRLTVREDLTPPVFTELLRDIQIRERETVTFSVTVEGRPTPQIQWLKDSQTIQFDTRIVQQEIDEQRGHYVVQLKDALITDTGLYSCQATNKAGQAKTESRVTVEELLETPKFTEGLRPVEVREGDSATMSVMVSGVPTPEVFWYKDGSPVEIDGQHIIRRDSDNQHSLTVQNATLRDAGTYTCQAKNKAGQCVTQAQLGVIEQLEAPKFVDGLKPIEVKEGETAKMSVQVDSKPAPKVQWFKDGQPVNVDGVHIVATDDGHGRHELIIKDAKNNDAGTYTCKASNKVGEAESQAKFAVIEELEAPKFVDGLKPVEVKEGETAKMSVEVTGKPEPEVQWNKDGWPIQVDNVHIIVKDEGKGQHSLTVKDANTADAGTYSCKATNKVGMAETQAKFGVIEDLEAPEFTKGLTPVEVKEGETAKMSVEVKGKPITQVQWFKDGQPVQIDGIHVVAIDDGHGKHELIIKDAKNSDAGTYSCKATNKAGSAETRTNFAVIEEMEAPKFVDGLKPVEVKEGETAKMSVEVTGKPEPEVQWNKDGWPVQVDNVHTIAKDEGKGRHSLTVKDANIADAGTYTCKAVNKAGQAETQAKFGVIEDVEAPRFTEPLKELTVEPGQNVANLECTVQGKPEPQVCWTRNGEPIYMDGVHAIAKKDDKGHHTLTISNAQKEDAGVYKCEAINKAGRDETSAPLKFPTEHVVEPMKEGQAQPIFSRKLEPQTVQEGESVEMSCQVNATESKPEIQWFHDGRQIFPQASPNIQMEQSSDGTLRLRILHATKDNVGEYRCEAVNPVGKAETSAPLRYAQQVAIEQPMEETFLSWRRQLQDQQVQKGTTNVVFECELAPTAARGIRFDWLKDGAILANKLLQYALRIEQSPDGFTQRLIFECAQFDHIGVYRCVATDVNGNQIWTEARLGVIAPAEGGEMAPGPPEFVELLKSATTTIGGTVVLRCKVKGFPRPTITWSRQGYGPVTATDRISMEYHDDGTIILTIKNAEMEDTGEYRCDAENEYGTAWTEGPIIVAAEGSLPIDGEAPDFTEPIRPITVRVGGTGILEGKVTGLPFPEIKWYKGDQLLVQGANPRYRIEAHPDGTQRLIISDAQLGDMDDYRCEASNKYGDVWSDVTLTVSTHTPEVSEMQGPTAPSFVKPLQEVHAQEGAPAELECVDGEPIDAGDVHFKQTLFPDGTARLTLPAARITDAGQFRCEATNPSGKASTEAPLRVVLAEKMPEIPKEMVPEFVEQLKPVQAKEGEEPFFECKIHGTPKPDVKWYKNGRELGPDDGKIESLPDGTQRLHLPPVGPNDDGNYYECVATNPAGSARSGAPLTVTPSVKETPPTFKRGLQDQNLPKGSPLVLDVEVDGKPTNVQWFKDGRPLGPGEDLGNGNYRLMVPELKDEGDFGKYSVQVSNGAGSADSSAAVTEAGKWTSISSIMSVSSVFSSIVSTVAPRISIAILLVWIMMVIMMSIALKGFDSTFYFIISTHNLHDVPKGYAFHIHSHCHIFAHIHVRTHRVGDDHIHDDSPLL